MARYVLLCRDREPDEAELARIAATPGVTVLDRAAPGAMLLDATEDAAAALREDLRGWVVAPEMQHPAP
ncbi:MAG: hypothetical protein HZB46_12075 [Solirubrobacterales bacterium]|nr:hypothetical protein [Solirubrobacterales bacterium]